MNEIYANEAPVELSNIKEHKQEDKCPNCGTNLSQSHTVNILECDFCRGIA